MVIQYDGGILFVAPNPSSALHKISEIYDRIAFAAVGRYNEFENLRKAGVRYADYTGYQYDRSDVTARGLANWYAQILGQFFTESNKPFEVELVVAEVGEFARLRPDLPDHRFDGSVAEEHGFVAMGGQADQVAAVLKDHYADGLPLVRALGAAIGGLAGQGNGDGSELSASQLEVGILARDRAHRTFRRADRAAAGSAADRGGRRQRERARARDTPATGSDEPQPGEAASPDDGVTP